VSFSCLACHLPSLPSPPGPSWDEDEALGLQANPFSAGEFALTEEAAQVSGSVLLRRPPFVLVMVLGFELRTSFLLRRCAIV
jgi:hypothetical protein